MVFLVIPGVLVVGGAAVMATPATVTSTPATRPISPHNQGFFSNEFESEDANVLFVRVSIVFKVSI